MNVDNQQRLEHIVQFYALLDTLAQKIKGPLTLENFSIGSSWVTRGVHFFFEQGEHRSDSGEGLRVVHIGTHAIRTGSRSTLWDSLHLQRGSDKDGAGSHRCSAFRKHIGMAYIGRDKEYHYEDQTWGRGNLTSHEVHLQEMGLEMVVSKTIRKMPYLYLAVEDEPSPYSQRAVISNNTVALLSNYNRQPIDPPSETWLGQYAHSKGDRIRQSGLWNVDHTDDDYDPDFLEILKHWIGRM